MYQENRIGLLSRTHRCVEVCSNEFRVGTISIVLCIFSAIFGCISTAIEKTENCI